MPGSGPAAQQGHAEQRDTAAHQARQPVRGAGAAPDPMTSPVACRARVASIMPSSAPAAPVAWPSSRPWATPWNSAKKPTSTAAAGPVKASRVQASRPISSTEAAIRGSTAGRVTPFQLASAPTSSSAAKAAWGPQQAAIHRRPCQRTPQAHAEHRGQVVQTGDGMQETADKTVVAARVHPGCVRWPRQREAGRTERWECAAGAG